MTRRDSSSLLARLLQAWRANPVAVKALSFGLIGVINSAVDFGVFSLGYYYFGLSILASQLIAWIIAVTGSYVMNSTITFAAESGRRLEARAYATFVFAQVAGLPGEHGHGAGRLAVHAGVGGQAPGDRRELRRQLLALALCRVSGSARRSAASSLA